LGPAASGIGEKPVKVNWPLQVADMVMVELTIRLPFQLQLYWPHW